MYFQKKPGNSEGEGGHDYGSLRAWGGGGVNAFWNFRRQGGGVKTWKPFVAGYGYFLELPNTAFCPRSVRYKQYLIVLFHLRYDV